MRLSILKTCALIFLLSIVTLQLTQAQTTQVNITADYPSGIMYAQQTTNITSIDPQSGELLIEMPNAAFEFRPALKPALKKEVDATLLHHNTTTVKAQIENFHNVDLSKTKQRAVRISGRFVFNGIASSFSEKGELLIENNMATLTLLIEVNVEDHGIETADKDSKLHAELIIKW